jgi:predicted alpha-1,2-mannosidase
MPNCQRDDVQRRTGGALLVVTLLVGTLLPIGLGTVPTAGAAPLQAVDPTTLVNPFIGTSGGGNTFPGAAVPFGMVQWSPDTADASNGAGYLYDSPAITGYGLTQLSGAGCPAEGDVPILPTVGTIAANPSDTTEPLVHSAETATPGYYALDAGGVTTQLTATSRSGMATFSFPSTSHQGNLLFKLSDSQSAVTSSQFHVVDSEEVEGSVTTGDFCGGSNSYTLHYNMAFNHPIASSGTWSTGGGGGYVSFDTSVTPVVEAKVGISYVSTANATLNRNVENPGWNFGAVREGARKLWKTMLGKIRVGGGTPVQQTVFYTALYHSLLEPNVFSDANGEYMGLDGEVHRVTGTQTDQYSNFSGWDIYRGDIQLAAVLAPERVNDIVTSMLNDYSEIGAFPKWEEDDGEAYIMVGDPADSIIADAYAFGATGFNAKQALSDMEAEASVPNNVRPGLNYDEKDGYLPIDGIYGCCNFYGPVSTQEEYDTADNAIAQLATDLGDKRLAKDFATRAQNWQNVFNPGSGFLQPKESSGVFEPGFSAASQNGFVEADSFIYTAMIPFDVRGVIAAEGGNKAWIDYLNGLTSSVTADGANQIQVGNEPSFDIPWEYDYAGAPAETEQVVREIQAEDFNDTPEGLPGNDDLGAVSSWYVWSALGAYPETPGSADLVLGSPLFNTTSVQLADGKTVTESVTDPKEGGPYVGHLTVDGKPWQRTFLQPGVFTRGGSLRWTLNTTPTAWGSASRDSPPSDGQGLLPALGYLDGATSPVTTVHAGGTTTLMLGAQSMSTATQQVRWIASNPPGSGLGIEPSSGTIVVPAEAKAVQSIEITAPMSAVGHQYTVVFALHADPDVALPDVVAQIDVVN